MTKCRNVGEKGGTPRTGSISETEAEIGDLPKNRVLRAVEQLFAVVSSSAVIRIRTVISVNMDAFAGIRRVRGYHPSSVGSECS
ncbi:MAG: hypothetical protein P8K66_10965 [Planctomycetota bacterium]|nr:hypothetical protein [Planctomycetota bacterium]